MDPRELGLQWEDRITDAVHPAGGRTWTYQERSDLVLDAVRELLNERITPLLDIVQELRRFAVELETWQHLDPVQTAQALRKIMEGGEPDES